MKTFDTALLAALLFCVLALASDRIARCSELDDAGACRRCEALERALAEMEEEASRARVQFEILQTTDRDQPGLSLAARVVDLEDAEGRLQKYGEEREMLRKDLADKQLELAARMRDPTGTTMVVAPPPIDGRVLAVSADVGLVLLSVGKDDRVQEGHVFTVFRGSEYVGKVRVQDVFKDQSSAKIVGEYERMTPREGDRVSTRVY